MKVRITRCYLVEVVDKKGFVYTYYDRGYDKEASDFCFGTKEDAKELGKCLMKEVIESKEEQ